MADQRRLDIRGLQRNVVRYALAGALTVAFATFALVMVPMYDRLKSASEDNLLRIAAAKGQALDQYLQRLVSVGRQISASPAAMDLLGGPANAPPFGMNALTAAVMSSDEIIGITRVDKNGSILAHIGETAPREVWPFDWDEASIPLISGPVKILEVFRFVITMPILSQSGERVGTDVFVFSVDALNQLYALSKDIGETGGAFLVFQIDGDPAVMSLSGPWAGQLINDAQLSNDLIEFFMTEAASGGQGLSTTGIFTYAYVPIPGRDLTLVFRKQGDEVFSGLQEQLFLSALGVLALVILSIGGMYLLLRPLTGQIVGRSDALQAQLQLAMDNMPSGLVMYDRDLRFVAYNQNFLELYGFEEGEIAIGMTRRESIQRLRQRRGGLIKDDTDDATAERERRVLKGGTTIEQEFIDGRTIEAMYGDWQDDLVVGVFTDVTERRRREEQIRESEAQLSLILETSPVAVTIIDGDTNERIFANARLAEFMGAETKEQVLAADIAASYANPNQLAELRHEFHTRGLVRNAEVKRYKMDGRTIWWALANWRPITYQGRNAYLVWNVDITERKQAEADLEAREAELRLALENMAGGILMLDADLNVQLVNDRYCEMYGVPRSLYKIGESVETAVRHNIERGLHASGTYIDEDIERSIVNRMEILASPHDDETERRLPNGTDLHVRKAAISGGGVVLIVTDITSRKAAQRELAQQTALLSATLENMSSGVTVFDRDMNYVAFNPQYERLWELEPGWLQPGMSFQHFLDRVGEMGLLPVDEADARYDLVKRGDFRGEVSLNTGRVIDIRYSGWVDDMLVGVLIDVSELKQREIELQVANREADAAEARVRGILETASEAIITIDENGLIEQLNAAAERMFGYSAGELDGQNISLLMGPADASRHDGHITRYLDTRDGKIIGRGRELTAMRKTGEVFPIYLSISHLQLPEGARFTGIISDITQQKAAEEQLIEAKQAAEAASEAKSAFLANMSHEIRTPMNAIIGLTRLALQTSLSPQQQDYLTKVQSSSQSLLGIINDILDFSKVEAGKMEMEAVDFQLDAVLEDLSNMMADRAGEKRLEMLFNIAPDVPLDLVGDPLRLGQILINLCSNAIKFTDDGEIVVGAQLLEIVDDEVRLQFTIRDTGIGMSREQQQGLFQPFTQADVSTTRKFGGTGLGLAICKRLVDMMNGEIWSESTVGQGTTMFFTGYFGRTPIAGRKRLTPELDLRGMKILVVDDNETARLVFSETLRSMSFEVQAVDSGEAAIEEIRRTHEAEDETPYRLVLLDWHMPGMDGVETARQIKALGLEKPIQNIIMISAFGREDVRRLAAEAGSSAFLIKPINQSTLFDTIMRVFSGEDVDERSDGRRKNRSLAEKQVDGLRVLLVEDNEINQQVATELLVSAGIQVDMAENGQLAIEKVTENGPDTYDAILMDLQMPVMDGYEATRTLRSDATYDKLPIIAMTAHALASERQKCLEAGMQDHVTKPIDPDRLFGALAHWTKGWNDGRENSRSIVLPKRVPPQTPQNAEPSRLPAELPGIDVPAALKMVRGNEALMLNLFATFQANYTGLDQVILAHLEAGRLDEATRAAHSLKGVGGNIQAMRVYEAAAALETALKALDENPPDRAKDTVSQELVALSGALEEVRDGLAPLLKDTLTADTATPDNHPASAPDITSANGVLRRMVPLLQEGDMSVESMVPDLRGYLAGSHSSDVEQIANLIADLEYDRALEGVKNLEKRLSV